MQHQSNLKRLHAILHVLKSWAQQVYNFFFQLTKSGSTCVLLLLFISLLLRMPMLVVPYVTQYDEVIYTDYVMAMIAEKPFVDIHPPLARILFTETARIATPFSLTPIPVEPGKQFGDFPFVMVRTLVALFGSILPLVIYGIGRALRYTPRVALLLGLFVATDNALIIYSRVMLPDILLLTFAFTALLLTFAFLQSSKTAIKNTYLLLLILSMACALSIKWTALGVLGVLFIYLILNKRILLALFFSIATCSVSALIFASYLMFYYPNGGQSINFPSPRISIWHANINFPPSHKLIPTLSYLPSLHKVMYEANYDPKVLKGTLTAPSPLTWPFAGNNMAFWSSSDGTKKIAVTGNSALWVTSFFVFLFDIFWIALRLRRTRVLPIDKDEMVLLAGYVMNYLPFFFIHRPMYLYHYFTALIFLILLLPKVTPRIIECLGNVTRDRLFAQVFVGVATVLIFVNFVLLLPATYGW